MTCAFLRATARNPLLRDLARRRFIGGPPGVSSSLISGYPPSSNNNSNSNSTNPVEALPLFEKGSSEFDVPFDFLHFLSLPENKAYLTNVSPAAAGLIVAYDYPLVSLSNPY